MFRSISESYYCYYQGWCNDEPIDDGLMTKDRCCNDLLGMSWGGPNKCEKCPRKIDSSRNQFISTYMKCTVCKSLLCTIVYVHMSSYSRHKKINRKCGGFCGRVFESPGLCRSEAFVAGV